MAAFALAFTATQSAIGDIVTITDTSNWGSNTEGYIQSQFDRQFILTDYNGDLIIAIVIADDELIKTWAVPLNTNPWVAIEYSSVGPVTLSKTQKYPFQRYFELAYKKVIKGNCGCAGKRFDICQVDAYVYGSELAVPIGDSIGYQNNINSAYALLPQKC